MHYYEAVRPGVTVRWSLWPQATFKVARVREHDIYTQVYLSDPSGEGEHLAFLDEVHIVKEH